MPVEVEPQKMKDGVTDLILFCRYAEYQPTYSAFRGDIILPRPEKKGACGQQVEDTTMILSTDWLQECRTIQG